MIEIAEQDGDAVFAKAATAHGAVTIVCRLRLLPDRLLLYDLHVDGPGVGTLGVGGLRRVVDEVMETYGVERPEIRGFRRTTGAGPGRVPSPLVFRRRARG